MKAIQLTKSDFLKKVVDYENNPTEWNYLGDKPAIIAILYGLTTTGSISGNNCTTSGHCF